jgi:small subunit ribosomal protein S10e
LPAHGETGVKNLEVWMLLRSMKDKGLVDVVFSWQYFYYYLKNEGVKFLRDKLGNAFLIIHRHR